jgi:hypothetical protein
LHSLLRCHPEIKYYVECFLQLCIAKLSLQIKSLAPVVIRVETFGTFWWKFCPSSCKHSHTDKHWASCNNCKKKACFGI